MAELRNGDRNWVYNCVRMTGTFTLFFKEMKYDRPCHLLDFMEWLPSFLTLLWVLVLVCLRPLTKMQQRYKIIFITVEIGLKIVMHYTKKNLKFIFKVQNYKLELGDQTSIEDKISTIYKNI